MTGGIKRGLEDHRVWVGNFSGETLELWFNLARPGARKEAFMTELGERGLQDAVVQRDEYEKYGTILSIEAASEIFDRVESLVRWNYTQELKPN